MSLGITFRQPNSNKNGFTLRLEAKQESGTPAVYKADGARFSGGDSTVKFVSGYSYTLTLTASPKLTLKSCHLCGEGVKDEELKPWTAGAAAQQPTEETANPFTAQPTVPAQPTQPTPVAQDFLIDLDGDDALTAQQNPAAAGVHAPTDNPFAPAAPQPSVPDPYSLTSNPFTAPVAPTAPQHHNPFTAPVAHASQNPFAAPAAAAAPSHHNPFTPAVPSAAPMGSNPFAGPVAPVMHLNPVLSTPPAVPAVPLSQNPFAAPSLLAPLSNQNPFAAVPATQFSHNPFAAPAPQPLPSAPAPQHSQSLSGHPSHNTFAVLAAPTPPPCQNPFTDSASLAPALNNAPSGATIQGEASPGLADATKALASNGRLASDMFVWSWSCDWVPSSKSKRMQVRLRLVTEELGVAELPLLVKVYREGDKQQFNGVRLRHVQFLLAPHPELDNQATIVNTCYFSFPT